MHDIIHTMGYFYCSTNPSVKTPEQKPARLQPPHVLYLSVLFRSFIFLVHFHSFKISQNASSLAAINLLFIRDHVR